MKVTLHTVGNDPVRRVKKAEILVGYWGGESVINQVACSYQGPYL